MAKKRNLRAVDSVAAPTSDLEAFNLYIEDELEELLDSESDADFGSIDYRTVEKKAKLSTWSAQDFSNIYLRYRPHLERHARRFLNNQTQVDEVVQDAFLYLMVTLPDLDSETGVLRFLKWKVRLICLDVIRASGRAIVNSIEDHAEFMADDPEISAGLEQADDAAIVKLALSKLNPRHREVLIASLYEEKSSEEIAAQVGLSENATRQLIFRARAAFKKALLGDDIDTEGMSVSAILSVAARRAAEEGKKIGAQAMVLLLFVVVATGAFFGFTRGGIQGQNLADTPVENRPTSDSTVPVESGKPVAPATSATAEPSKVSAPAAAAAPSPSPTLITDDAALKLVAASATGKPLTFITGTDAQSTSMTIELAGGVQTSFVLNPNLEQAISQVNIRVPNQGGFINALPTAASVHSAYNDQGNLVVSYQAKLGYLYDSAGHATNDSALNSQSIEIVVVVSADSQSVISANSRLI